MSWGTVCTPLLHIVSCRPAPAREEVTVIDELVVELHGALRAIRLDVPGEPDDPGVLDEIDVAIAPARLPHAARRLWELVDPRSLQHLVSFYPLLAAPGVALQTWREDESNQFIGGPPGHFLSVLLREPRRHVGRV